MDQLKTEKWKELLALARKGDADAQHQVGYYFQYGTESGGGKALVTPDAQKAFAWYEKSAKQGNAHAQCALGVLLSTGEGIAPDYVAALYWNQLAVEQGVAPAAYNQGTIYRDLNKPAMAFRCYGRAAAMGDYDACLQMGLCCLFAYGTKQDFDKAYGYFERVVKSASRAVSQRSLENALYWMALLDLMGKGRLKRSVVRARKMLEAANADEDHEQANELLNLIGKTRYLKR